MSRFSYVVKNLYVTIPISPVGIKRGVASAGGDANYYEDFGYNFVQKFGSSDLPVLPPDDAASQVSGSTSYYWEGLPNDGLNILPEHSLYHPTDWNIIWNAASLVDVIWESDWIASPYHLLYAAKLMTGQVHNKMTYENTDTYPYYFHSCAISDSLIIQAGWKGVCDEFATIEVSMLRALGIPARQMYGSGATAHAWLEVWILIPYGFGSKWTWIHADPTNSIWDIPWYYRIFGGYTTFNITFYYDDHMFQGNATTDGSSTNGRLVYAYIDPVYYTDVRWVAYDGPNNY